MIINRSGSGAGGGGSSSDSFKTIQTDLGTSPVASSPTSILTLGDGGDVETEGDETSDSIIFHVLNSAVIGKLLTGFSSSAGVVAATDTILQAFNKIVGNIAAVDANSNIIGKVLTGFTAGAGTVSATDTILQAFQKVVGNLALLSGAEVDHGDMGASETFDFSQGPAHYGNISADCAVTLSNGQSGAAYSLLIEGNGTNEITWSTTVDWLGAGAPDFSAMADGELGLVNIYWSAKKSTYVGSYKLT